MKKTLFSFALLSSIVIGNGNLTEGESLGMQGFRVQQKDSLALWVKPLSNGSWAVCFLNRGSEPHVFNHTWAAQVTTDTVSNRVLDCSKQTYSLYDVWNRKKAGTTGKPFAAPIPGHDVVLITLSANK